MKVILSGSNISVTQGVLNACELERHDPLYDLHEHDVTNEVILMQLLLVLAQALAMQQL